MLLEILGIDAGNFETKIFGKGGPMKFPSLIGEYREFNLDVHMKEYDFIFEYNGKKGFAGTLAERESELAASIFTTSKAHDELILRVLIAIHKYSNDNKFKIIIGQPISKHTPEQKTKMKKMIKGEHEITINNVTKKINIERVEVAAEGAAAYWSNPVYKGKVHVIDVGSGTINCATLLDGDYIDRDSFTLSFGMETLKNKDLAEISRKIHHEGKRRRWGTSKVLVCGGSAEVMFPHLVTKFVDVDLLKPKYVKKQDNGGMKAEYLSPTYANAVGFYNIGKVVLADE